MLTFPYVDGTYFVLTFLYVDVSAGTHGGKEMNTLFADDSNHKHANNTRAYVMLTFPYVDVTTYELTSSLRFLMST